MLRSCCCLPCFRRQCTYTVNRPDKIDTVTPAGDNTTNNGRTVQVVTADKEKPRVTFARRSRPSTPMPSPRSLRALSQLDLTDAAVEPKTAKPRLEIAQPKPEIAQPSLDTTQPERSPEEEQLLKRGINLSKVWHTTRSDVINALRADSVRIELISQIWKEATQQAEKKGPTSEKSKPQVIIANFFEELWRKGRTKQIVRLLQNNYRFQSFTSITIPENKKHQPNISTEFLTARVEQLLTILDHQSVLTLMNKDGAERDLLRLYNIITQTTLADVELLKILQHLDNDPVRLICFFDAVEERLQSATPGNDPEKMLPDEALALLVACNNDCGRLNTIIALRTSESCSISDLAAFVEREENTIRRVWKHNSAPELNRFFATLTTQNLTDIQNHKKHLKQLMSRWARSQDGMPPLKFHRKQRSIREMETTAPLSARPLSASNSSLAGSAASLASVGATVLARHVQSIVSTTPTRSRVIPLEPFSVKGIQGYNRYSVKDMPLNYMQPPAEPIQQQPAYSLPRQRATTVYRAPANYATSTAYYYTLRRDPGTTSHTTQGSYRAQRAQRAQSFTLGQNSTFSRAPIFGKSRKGKELVFDV